MSDRFAVQSLRVPALSSLVVAGLSFAYFLTYPLAIGKADESHLLYGAKRVLDGQVIYKDFFEPLTPLSYYLFAAIYRVAGTTLLAARVGIAVIEAVGCALLFHLVRRVSSMVEAALAGLIFAGICIPAWPYASAHWISTTFGLLVATVTLADRWQQSARARPLVAGMLAGVAVCVQQQRGAFLAAWIPLALCVLAFSRPRGRRWRTLGTEIAWGVGGVALVTLVVLGHAAWATSPAAVVYALYEFNIKHYPSEVGGVAWAAVLLGTQQWRASTWIWLLRVAPLFLVGEGALLLRSGRRPRERSDLERACLWLLAVLMGLSVVYLPDFIHVSFVLPFLLIPGATLLHALRTAPLWARMPAGRHAATVGVCLFALAVVRQCVANVASAHAAAPVRLETGFGAVQVDPNMAELFNTVHRHLVREPDGRRLLFSYPDDAWLYLALPADDATRFNVMTPSIFPPEHVQEVIDAVRARCPGTIVLMRIDAGQVSTAIEEGYDMVEEAGRFHRVYVRRSPRAFE